MTRHALIFVALMGATLAAPSAGAAELQLTAGSQASRDAAFGLVSEADSASMFGIRLGLPVAGHERLTWLLGYESGGVSEWAYSEALDVGVSVSTSLVLNAVDAGIRVERPLGRIFVPYASATARAMVGSLKVEDSLTGWTLDDPADPTGEGVLYEARPYRDVGASIGAQATVGVALRFGGQGGGDGALSPQAALPGDWASLDPAMGLAAQAEGPPGDGQGGGGGAPAADPSAALERWADSHPWGFFFEGGYALQTGMRFTEAGTLGMGGARLLGGVFVSF